MVSIFRSQNPLKYENVNLNKQQVLRKQRTPRSATLTTKIFVLTGCAQKCFPTVYYMPVFRKCPIWVILGYFRGY